MLFQPYAKNFAARWAGWPSSRSLADSFVVRESATEKLTTSASSAVKYDLIGKLAEDTQLTRKTIATILQGINVARFGQFKTNPEDFIQKAGTLINEQKATVIVEHLAYSPIDERHSIDIFTQPKKEDLSKGFKANRAIYDYVFTDSSNERTFVGELDASAEVTVYAKLPKAFQIPTPVGGYNPDWAVAFQDGKVKHIYFVAETKGSMSSMDLRKIEESKIDCARKFFAKITSEQVKYDVVNSYEKLMELVKQDALPGKHGEYEMVLTNPPFGKKSSVTIVNEARDEEKQSLVVHRDNFWASTSNKQLNFLQHVFTILKQHGRAAIVVPDNVLFEGGAGESSAAS